jgi:hypothetical protein
VNAKPTTLSQYLAESPGQQRRVLVEHRCGRPLGRHVVSETDYGPVISKAEGGRLTAAARHLGLQPTSVERGPETTPGVRGEPFDREPYSRVFCECLPAGHTEKWRPSKLGRRPVTFPDWKWGRPIDLPVVTI